MSECDRYRARIGAIVEIQDGHSSWQISLFAMTSSNWFRSSAKIYAWISSTTTALIQIDLWHPCAQFFQLQMVWTGRWSPSHRWILRQLSPWSGYLSQFWRIHGAIQIDIRLRTRAETVSLVFLSRESDSNNLPAPHLFDRASSQCRWPSSSTATH